MKTYTYEELDKMTFEKLTKIKSKKQDELYALKEKKHRQIINILSLQGLIELEKK